MPLESLPQRRQILTVSFGIAGHFSGNWLADLYQAEGGDGPLGFMKIEAGFVPLESHLFHQFNGGARKGVAVDSVICPRQFNMESGVNTIACSGHNRSCRAALMD